MISKLLTFVASCYLLVFVAACIYVVGYFHGSIAKQEELTGVKVDEIALVITW